MAFCTKCGKEIDNSDKFCPSCGLPANNNEKNVFNGASDAFASINNTADTTNTYNADDIEQNKVFAALAYLAILFFIPLVVCPTSKFGRFHANQGLVLFIFEIIAGIACGICGVILGILFPFSLILVGLINLVFGAVAISLTIIGIINAVNGKAKELPVIGHIKLIK